MPPPPRRHFHNPRQTGGQASGGKPPIHARAAQSEQGWDPVAAWYDKLVGESGSDYHRQVILPATLRLLAPQPGQAVIDVCCGQGVLFKPLLDAGISKITGIDASPQLVAAAKARHGADRRVHLITADACAAGAWAVAVAIWPRLFWPPTATVCARWAWTRTRCRTDRLLQGA